MGRGRHGPPQKEPNSDGLQPTSDGLQPTIVMASNLL